MMPVPRNLWILRHAPTAFSVERRLAGRSDLPLSPEGLESLQHWRLPEHLRSLPLYASPLRRARQTAEALAEGRRVQIEPALAEQDFGRFEGRSLKAIRAEAKAQGQAETLAAAERQGRLFQPPGGESPAMLQARLLPFLARLGRQEGSGGAVLIAHRGVMRALIGLATGWDMVQDLPQPLPKDAAAIGLSDRLPLPVLLLRTG